MSVWTIADYLTNRVERDPDGCWIYTGYIEAGYGRLRRLDGTRLAAHRASYEFYVGPIPDGLVVDHLCRNKACVRPDHLEVVTIAENNRRGRLANPIRNPPRKPRTPRRRITHCGQGHLFDEDNTYVQPGTGFRLCRTCERERRRARRASP